MTKQLAHANITSVMNDERRKQTEQKLIRSGRAEFLEKGYAKANLRDICKAVGVTTGAFYFSFENKEALLRMDEFIADQQLNVKRAQDRMEKARLALQSAMQESKTQEKLREKAFELFVKEENKRESKEIDELVSYTYGRKA